MTLTLRKWELNKDRTPNYFERHEIRISGGNAKACMEMTMQLKETNDLSRFTPLEIINVEDE